MKQVWSFYSFLRFALVISLLMGLFIAVPPVPVRASSVIIVNSLADNETPDTYCTLREALINANLNLPLMSECASGSNGVDTIVFDGSLGIATITLGSSLDITDAHPLVIDGGSVITVSGNNLVRVFLENTSSTLTLQNITVSNGNIPTSDGGGIYVQNGTLNVINSAFSGNSAPLGYGGGIASRGTLTITDSFFSSNTGYWYGGAIQIFAGDNSITGSTFYNNVATGDSCGGVYCQGGGISILHGSMTITNSSFLGNTGVDGGGIYSGSGTSVIISNSAFLGNTAYNLGGGISCSGPMTISNSYLDGNETGANWGYGGGIYMNYTCNLTVVNDTFSNNLAFLGGGLMNDGGTAAILNNTFSNNIAYNGGGVATGTDGFRGIPSTTIRNTILANSIGRYGSLTGDCVNVDLGFITGSNNIIESTSTCMNIATITSDPSLDNLAGSPAYFPLLSDSPAIDAGDDATCTEPPVYGLDQRGEARPFGAHCDIGSYEFVDIFGPTVTVEQAVSQADPTNASPIYFIATFNEPINVSTFTGSDVTLGGTATGTLSANVSEISPNNGTTFSIAVSGMTGSGMVTASLDASNVTDLAGNGNDVSSSSDNNVTYNAPAPTERVKNGGFETYSPSTSKKPVSWVAVNFSTLDGKNTTHQAGKYSVKLTGAGTTTKTLTQTITKSGLAGDAFAFSYYVKASSLPTSGLCQAQVLFYSGTSLKGTKTLKCPTGTYNWKQMKLNFTAPAAYTKIIVKFTFKKSSGAVWFDGVSLKR